MQKYLPNAYCIPGASLDAEAAVMTKNESMSSRN